MSQTNTGKMHRGTDNELLTETLVTISDRLFRIVNGEIKHALQQEDRYRRNPLGLNHKDMRTIDEFPEWLAAPAAAAPCDFERTAKNWKRKIARRFLREAMRSETSLKLVKQVLLNGEDPQKTSQSLNIKYATARSLIARGKNSLGLPGRTGTQKKQDQRRSR
jgi:hypothetical protein